MGAGDGEGGDGGGAGRVDPGPMAVVGASAVGDAVPESRRCTIAMVAIAAALRIALATARLRRVARAASPGRELASGSLGVPDARGRRRVGAWRLGSNGDSVDKGGGGDWGAGIGNFTVWANRTLAAAWAVWVAVGTGCGGAE